jgi:hypothetical protein
MPIRSSKVADSSAPDSRVSWRWKSQMPGDCYEDVEFAEPVDRRIDCGMQRLGVVDGGHGEPAVAVRLRLDGLGELGRGHGQR